MQIDGKSIIKSSAYRVMSDFRHTELWRGKHTGVLIMATFHAGQVLFLDEPQLTCFTGVCCGKRPAGVKAHMCEEE